jgi:hypothetical protein
VRGFTVPYGKNACPQIWGEKSFSETSEISEKRSVQIWTGLFAGALEARASVGGRCSGAWARAREKGDEFVIIF